MVRDGVRQARKAGYEDAYLIAEEHAPLAPCHEWHLNHTIPRALRQWDAAYISLMGWDNRRYASRNPILPRERHRMMHLIRPHAPRFHLHPALWRLDTLENCCDLSLRNPEKGGSAWHFEKTCEKFDADLPSAWKKGCYQIAAHALSLETSPGRTARTLTERWVYNRLMATLPWIPKRSWHDRYFRVLAWDNVFCNGPYPMIFSGLLQKGRLNEHLARHLVRTPAGRTAWAQITSAFERHQPNTAAI